MKIKLISNQHCSEIIPIIKSPEKLSALKARLSDLAQHAYCGAPVDIGDFLMYKECLKTIKALRSNTSILITKGSGVVILNKNRIDTT